MNDSKGKRVVLFYSLTGRTGKVISLSNGTLIWRKRKQKKEALIQRGKSGLMMGGGMASYFYSREEHIE